MNRQAVINERTVRLVHGFSRYVMAYDQLVPFTGEQLAAHRETISLRSEAGSVRAAVSDSRFLASLRRTLLAWGIGVRASRLVPEAAFAQRLAAAAPVLEPLEALRIDSQGLPADLADRLWRIVDQLGVVENQAKLVAGTKTLHHLLPDLVVPMDRAWTGRFFQLHLPEWQDPASQRRILRLTYGQLVGVAQQAQPEQYVTGEGWRTCRAKILDNALIGFCKLELAENPPPATAALPQVSFEVAGYPPAKNEALSMLGAGHPHAPRVRLLLEAARQACQQQDFKPVESGPLALDVVIRVAPGQIQSDATNYLGGIGDVLENKAHRGVLDHLGGLAAVWLYRNDRQIKRITYREEAACEPSYTVIVRRLAEHEAP